MAWPKRGRRDNKNTNLGRFPKCSLGDKGEGEGHKIGKKG